MVVCDGRSFLSFRLLPACALSTTQTRSESQRKPLPQTLAMAGTDVENPGEDSDNMRDGAETPSVTEAQIQHSFLGV